MNGNGLGQGRGGLPGNNLGGDIPGSNGPGASGPGSDFAARNALLALKILARNLSSLPGRKALILFTGGLAISEDHMAELTAAVNACNMANVTVYTVDGPGHRASRTGFPEHSNGMLAGLRQKLLAPVSFLDVNNAGENIGGFATSFLPQGRGGAAVAQAVAERAAVEQQAVAQAAAVEHAEAAAERWWNPGGGATAAWSGRGTLPVASLEPAPETTSRETIRIRMTGQETPNTLASNQDLRDRSHGRIKRSPSCW